MLITLMCFLWLEEELIFEFFKDEVEGALLKCEEKRLSWSEK